MSSTRASTMRFELGQIVVTPRAAAAIEAHGQTVEALLARHQAGDWGDVTEIERQCNLEGIERRYSLVSHYALDHGERLTITTRADRSCTMVHLGPPQH